MNKFIVTIETRWTQEEMDRWLTYVTNNANDSRHRGPGFVPPIITANAEFVPLDFCAADCDCKQ